MNLQHMSMTAPLVSWAKATLLHHYTAAHVPAFSRSFSFASSPAARQRRPARHPPLSPWLLTQTCTHSYSCQAAAPTQSRASLAVGRTLFVSAFGAAASALYLASKAGQQLPHLHCHILMTSCQVVAVDICSCFQSCNSNTQPAAHLASLHIAECAKL